MGTNPLTEPAVLTSWKEIAQYIGKSVRSVQRWEQHFGLPVRRPAGARNKSVVLAKPAELDRWIKSWRRRGTGPENSKMRSEAHACLVEQVHNAVQDSVSLRTAQRELVTELRQGIAGLISSSEQLQRTRRASAELSIMVSAWHLMTPAPDAGGAVAAEEAVLNEGSGSLAHQLKQLVPEGESGCYTRQLRRSP